MLSAKRVFSPEDITFASDEHPSVCSESELSLQTVSEYSESDSVSNPATPYSPSSISDAEIVPKESFLATNVLSVRANGHPTTTLVCDGKRSLVYSADKSRHLLRTLYTNEENTKKRTLFSLSWNTHVLSLALSRDGTRLASGHADGTLSVWDVSSETQAPTIIHTFKSPKGKVSAVLGLAFQPTLSKHLSSDSETGDDEEEDQVQHHRSSTDADDPYGILYAACGDRAIRIYSLYPEPALLDTLFGHQDEVQAVASTRFGQCLSVGGRDGTVRLWCLESEKEGEQQQLLFRSPQAPVDLLAMLNGDTWITSASSTIFLWQSHRKKPIASHQMPSPVTCMTALTGKNFAVGLVDGSIYALRAEVSERAIHQLGCMAHLAGFPNAMSSYASKSHEGTFVVIGCGMEGRLGRQLLIRRGKAFKECNPDSSRSSMNRLHWIRLPSTFL